MHTGGSRERICMICLKYLSFSYIFYSDTEYTVGKAPR